MEEDPLVLFRKKRNIDIVSLMGGERVKDP